MEQEQELEQEQDKLTHILIHDVDSEVNSSESMKQKGSKESTVNLKAIDKFQVKLTRLLQDIPDEDIVLDVKSIEKTSESERPKGSGESTTKLTVDLKAVERDQVKLTQLLEDISEDVVLDVKSIEKTSESERPKGSGESTTNLTVDLKAVERDQVKLTQLLEDIPEDVVLDVKSIEKTSESERPKGSGESTTNLTVDLKAVERDQVKLTELLEDIPEDVVLDVKSIEKTSESERPKGSGESTTNLTVDLKAVERDQVKLTQLLEDIPDGPLEMPKEKEEVECDALLPSFAEKHRSIFKEAINKCDKEKLFDFCSNFNVIIINKSRAKKEDVLAKILEAYDSGCFSKDILHGGQQWSEELVDCCYVPDKPINSRCATAGCKPNIPNATFGSVFVDKAVNLELMEKESDKFPYLYQYYGSCELNVVVCCEFRSDVDDVHAYLTKKGVQTAAVHGGLLPSERVKGLDEFKAGTADVLVITGHLLLGQTFPFDVALINYDLPINFDEFKARVPIGHEVVTLVSRYSPHNSLVQLASELGLEVPAFITDIIRDPPPIKGRKSEKEIWDH